MSIFDAIQNLVGGAADAAGGVTDSVTGAAGDAASGIADNQVVQDVQDHASTVVDGATEATSSATEQGQTVADDITQNLGL